MDTWQDPCLTGDRTHLIELSPVGPYVLFNDKRADRLLDGLVGSLCDSRIAFGKIRAHPLHDIPLKVIDRAFARGLIRILDVGPYLGSHLSLDCLKYLRIRQEDRYLTLYFAGLLAELLLQLALLADHLMPKIHRFEYLRLCREVCARLDHDDGGLRAGDNEVEIGRLYLGLRRIHDVLTV